MSSDQIRVKGIEAYGYHGVFEEEQDRGQPFLVDLVMNVDLDVAGRTDRLADTLDYGEVVRRVHDVVALEQWDLIERVASRIADTVLEFNEVKSVGVTVHKPEALRGMPNTEVSVRITRSR